MTITQRSHTANNYNPLQQIDVKLFPDPSPFGLGRLVHAWLVRLTSMNDENYKMHFKDIKIMKVT